MKTYELTLKITLERPMPEDDLILEVESCLRDEMIPEKSQT